MPDNLEYVKVCLEEEAICVNNDRQRQTETDSDTDTGQVSLFSVPVQWPLALLVACSLAA